MSSALLQFLCKVIRWMDFTRPIKGYGVSVSFKERASHRLPP